MKGGGSMNQYTTSSISAGRRKLLRALGIEVVEIPEDEVVCFPVNSSSGYYLPKSSTQ